jgi:hypothetical protein
MLINQQCPKPTAGLWNSGQVATFAALMAAAKSRGWIVPVTAYPSANWNDPAHFAASPVLGVPCAGANVAAQRAALVAMKRHEKDEPIASVAPVSGHGRGAIRL